MAIARKQVNLAVHERLKGFQRLCTGRAVSIASEASMSDSCSVRVISRFRPMNDREKRECSNNVDLKFVENHSVSVTGATGQKLSFTFDAVIQMEAKQEQVYEVAARDTIVDVLQGFNGTIFAYGQTGSGKTFTMMGISSDEENRGIIPRASAHIFQSISESAEEDIEFQIKCSYLEIYNESIQDLFDTTKKNLKVHEDPQRGVYVAGLTEEYVAEENDILDLIDIGGRNRSVAQTAMNAESSRSHSLFVLQIIQKAADGTTRSGRLNLVDLAGSEKVAKTNVTGQALEEAKKINQSLSALGNCIHALTEESRRHVPYRDSKLTRILQDSLGGNTKTTLICTVSPHSFNIEETINTLRFGQRAKTIKNKVHQNVQRSAAELQRMLEKALAENELLKAKVTGLQKLVDYMKSSAYDPSVGIPEDVQQAVDAAVEGAVAKAAEGGEEAMGAVLSMEKAMDTEKDRMKKENMLHDLEEELENKKSELASKAEQFDTLSNELKEKDAVLGQLQSDMDAEREQVEKVRERLEYERRQHELECQTLSTELESQREEYEELAVQLAAQERAVANAEQEKEKAKNELELLKTEQEVTFEELEQAETYIVELEEKSTKLGAEIAKLKRSNEELENEQSDLQEYAEQLETDLADAQLQTNKTEAKLEIARKEAEDLKAQLTDARTHSRQMEAALEGVDPSLVDTTPEAAGDDAATGELQAGGAAGASRRRPSVIAGRVKRLEENVDVANQTIQELREKLGDGTVELEKLRLSKEQVQKKLVEEQDKSTKMTEKIHEYEERLEELQKSLDAAKAKAKDDRKVVDEENKRKTALSHLEEEMEKMRTELNDSASQLAAERARASGMKLHSQSLKAQKEGLEGRLKEQEARLESVEASNESITKDLASEKEKSANLAREKDDLEEKLKALQLQLDEANSQISIRSYRARVWKPVKSGGVLDSFREKEDFGQHILKKVNTGENRFAHLKY